MSKALSLDSKGKGKIVANGIFASNPVFRLVLGMCPTLAISTSAFNGLGMGIAATVVLVCSNLLVSLLRKVIPDRVRIPAYVLIIATFVTMVEMLLRKYVPALYDALGIYLPLIVVNCIILARAEAFASQNGVGDSVLDGLGMGLGFTLALVLLGFIREFLGSGTVFVGELGDASFGLVLGDMPDYALNVFVLPAGGFLTLGLVMAAINAVSAKIEKDRKAKSASAVAVQGAATDATAKVLPFAAVTVTSAPFCIGMSISKIFFASASAARAGKIAAHIRRSANAKPNDFFSFRRFNATAFFL